MPPSFRKARRTLSRLRPFRKRRRGAGPGGPVGASAVGASAGGRRDSIPISPVGSAGEKKLDDRVKTKEYIGCAEQVKPDGRDRHLPSNSPVSNSADEAVVVAPDVPLEDWSSKEEKDEIEAARSAASVDISDNTLAPPSPIDDGIVEEEEEEEEKEEEKNEIESFSREMVGDVDDHNYAAVTTATEERAEPPEGGEDGRDEGDEGDREERAEGERDEGISKTRTFASLATLEEEFASRDDATTTVDDANEDGHRVLLCGEVTLDDLWARNIWSS